jgi:hypothetical protein
MSEPDGIVLIYLRRLDRLETRVEHFKKRLDLADAPH